MTLRSAVLTFSIAISSSANADCNPIAFFGEDLNLNDNLSRLAYFETLDQSQYEKKRVSGQLGATLPIYGVPVQFDADYSKAKETVQQLKRLFNIEFSSEHHQAIYTHLLSSNGLQAYKECVSHQGPGTILWRSSDALTSETFFIGVKWVGPVGNAQSNFDFVGKTPFLLQGGRVLGAYARNPPRRIRNGEEITVEIKRDLAVPLRFAVAIAGYTGRIELPALNIKQVKFAVKNSPEIYVYANWGRGGNNGGPMSESQQFTPGPSAEFLPATAYFVGTTGPYRAEYAIDHAEAQRISWHAFAEAASKQSSTHVKGYISAIVAYREN